MDQKPIFIVGARKSGSSLLRSLFDGHSQLWVIPIETQYFKNMRYWVDDEYSLQRPQLMNQDEILQSFCDWTHVRNTVEDKYGDSVTRGLFDENKFRDHFSLVRSNESDKQRI